jgi:hypothetical protein
VQNCGNRSKSSVSPLPAGTPFCMYYIVNTVTYSLHLPQQPGRWGQRGREKGLGIADLWPRVKLTPLPTWDELRIALLAIGRRPVVWVQIYCATDGLLRLAIDGDDYPRRSSCPLCGRPCRASAVARGLTSIPPVKQIVPPLSPISRHSMLTPEPLVRRLIQADRHKRKSRLIADLSK